MESHCASKLLITSIHKAWTGTRKSVTVNCGRNNGNKGFVCTTSGWFLESSSCFVCWMHNGRFGLENWCAFVWSSGGYDRWRRYDYVLVCEVVWKKRMIRCVGKHEVHFIGIWDQELWQNRLSISSMWVYVWLYIMSIQQNNEKL